MDYSILLDFLNALAVNYLVFYLVVSFFKAETKVWRLMVAGGAYAAAAVAEKYIKTDTILLKAIVSIIGILVSKKEFDFKEFLRFSSLYIVLRLALAGAEELLGGFFSVDNSFDIAVSASVILCVILFKTVSGLRDIRLKRPFEYRIEVEKDGKSYYFGGFVDTGNAMYKDGEPVIVISEQVASKLSLEAKDKLIVSTLSGIKEMPLAEMSYKIYYDKKTHKLYNSFAVVSGKMGLRGYDILLHKDMLK